MSSCTAVNSSERRRWLSAGSDIWALLLIEKTVPKRTHDGFTFIGRVIEHVGKCNALTARRFASSFATIPTWEGTTAPADDNPETLVAQIRENYYAIDHLSHVNHGEDLGRHNGNQSPTVICFVSR